MRKITKFNPFSYQTFDFMESWYEDLAQKGLVVKEAGGLFSAFEESKPTKRKYRILPISIMNISDEEKDLFDASGWKYVSTTGDMSLFYNDNLDAEEIYTDDDSWKKRYKKSLVLNIIVIPIAVLWIILAVKNFFWFSDPIGPYHTWDVSISDFVIVGICCLSMVLYWIKRIIDCLHFSRKMNNYMRINHNISYKHERNIWKIIYIGLIAPLVVFVASFMITHQVGGGTMLSAEKSLEYKNDNLVRFRSFDNKSWNKYKDCIFEVSDDGESANYFIFKDRSLIESNVREQFHVDKDTYKDGEPIGDYQTVLNYDVGVYNFLSEKCAEGYINEEIAYDTYVKDGNVAAEKIKIDCDEVDYAGYYKEPVSGRDKPYSYQSIYLRLEDKAIIVYYTGEKDLLGKLPIYVKKLR